MIKRFLVVFWLFIVFIASSWALLRTDFFRVHDYTHGARIAEMTRALQEGQFPVRWTGNFGYGYGMPLFEFYAPLPFYAGSFFYWLGLDIVNSVRAIFLLANVLTLIGGYLLGKELFGRRAGLVLSTLLTLAPYRALNLYIRGAISEAWGIAFLPWILYGLVLTSRGRPHGWWLLTLSLTALMLSHNLTTLMFIPLSLVFLLSLELPEIVNKKIAWREWLVRNLKIAGTYLLAGGLSAFYMIPAVTENHHTNINSILSGYFHYSQHFLYIRQLVKPFWGYGGSEWGPNDPISFFLGYGQLIGLALGGLVLAQVVYHQLRAKKFRLTRALSVGLFALALLGLSLYFSLMRSEPVWNALPFMKYFQFPWRWLSPAIVWLSLAAAAGISQLKLKAFTITLTLLIVTLWNASYYRPESWTSTPLDFYYDDAGLIRTEMSSILPDYIPTGVPKDIAPTDQVFWFKSQPIPPMEKNKVLINRGHEKLVDVTIERESDELTFAAAEFPGWQAYLDGRPVNHFTSEQGLVTVSVPSGAHQVGLTFESTPVRYWADVISTLSLCLLILIYLHQRSRYAKAN